MVMSVDYNSDNPKASAEMAFRRGYHHGVVLLRDFLYNNDCIDEFTHDLLTEYEEEVLKWRFQEILTGDETIFPPTITK